MKTEKFFYIIKSGDVTTHYSPAELEELINAVEKIVEKESGINFDKKKCRKRITVKLLNTKERMVGRERFERSTIALKVLTQLIETE